MDIPGARSIYDIYRDKLAAMRSCRMAITPDLVRQVSGIALESGLSTEFVPSEGGAVIVRDDDETMIPVVVCRTNKASGKQPLLIVSDVSARVELADRIC